MTDRDDLDPADWLAQQFGEDPEPVTPPAPAEPPEPVTPPKPPEPVTPPKPPFTPPPLVPGPPPVAPTSAPPPVTASTSPEVPAPTSLPLPDLRPVAAEPPEKRTAAAPFQWGLTPGDEPTPPIEPPVAPPPIIPPPVAPPAAPVEPVDVPTQAFSHADLPTTALPVPPPPPPGRDLDTVAFDAAAWMAAPLDPAIEGATEVIEAELVGLATPEGEGVPATAIDNLFGAGQFQEYDDKALIPALPPRDEKPPRGPMPTAQKVLLWVAGVLVALLVLLGLFLLGKSFADNVAPAPAVTASPTPTPTPTATALPVGPVAPGEHQWDALLGGECIVPWESAWQDTYTVVDCATPHPAQMVFRGTFDDAADVAYPGVEELQKRMNVLCTPTTVIDYSKAGMLNDVQVSASFAADAADWDDGNRTYFCFLTRSSGQNFTESVAVPQVAPAP